MIVRVNAKQRHLMPQSLDPKSPSQNPLTTTNFMRNVVLWALQLKSANVSLAIAESTDHQTSVDALGASATKEGHTLANGEERRTTATDQHPHQTTTTTTTTIIAAPRVEAQRAKALRVGKVMKITMTNTIMEAESQDLHLMKIPKLTRCK